MGVWYGMIFPALPEPLKNHLASLPLPFSLVFRWHAQFQPCLQCPLSNSGKLGHTLAKFLIRSLCQNFLSFWEEHGSTWKDQKVSDSSRMSKRSDVRSIVKLLHLPGLFKDLAVKRAVQESFRDLLNVLDPYCAYCNLLTALIILIAIIGLICNHWQSCYGLSESISLQHSRPRHPKCSSGLLMFTTPFVAHGIQNCIQLLPIWKLCNFADPEVTLSMKTVSEIKSRNIKQTFCHLFMSEWLIRRFFDYAFRMQNLVVLTRHWQTNWLPTWEVHRSAR